MLRTSRYSISIRMGGQSSSNRPFAPRDAIDCSPPKRLRWYHVAALAGSLAVLTTILAWVL